MIERDIVSKKTSKACRKLTKIDGHVQFINVCFTYPSRPDVVIFNNLYLEIPSDKNDIKELDLKWLRQQIGLVNQEPALFATSIRENILYGKNDATPEELNRALELSNANSFINNLPDGLDTQLIMLQQHSNINKLS
ncbi:ABC transporter B member [Trifolium repens]|nr:ABC transporter B member [Trifolium repens]